MGLAERRRLRLFTLCVLYVAQGIPWGFMVTTLPAYLVHRGLDFGFVTAALSFTTLPYTFKWVWGPIIDAVTIPRFGRRRPWILFAQAMMAATVLAMIAIPDLGSQLTLLAWMILIHTVFNAMQDVAVDALATDLLGDDERGRANGFMYASKYAGGALGGVGMGKLIASAGLQTALVAQAAVLVAIMLVPLLVREREQAPAEPARVHPQFGAIARGLGQAFSLRSTLVAALLALSMNFTTGMMSATGYLLFVGELRWSYDDYLEITGGWGLAIGCAFAATTGLLVDRFGRRRVAAIASLGLAAGWAFFALAPQLWTNQTLVYGLGFYEAACQAVLNVALIALCMDLSWPRVAGSQFAAYMALSNFSTTLGYQFAAKANALWEFGGVYLVAASIQVLVPLLLIPIDPMQARRELRDESPIRWMGIAALLALLTFLIGMTAYITVGKLS